MRRPIGNQVSHAFASLPSEATATGRDVRHALRAIDSVHGVGTVELPRIPIKEEVNPLRFGAYVRTAGGQPVGIAVEQRGDHRRLTTAHEIGHFLDHQAFGTQGEFASEMSIPEMVAWKRVAEESDAVLKLRDMLATRRVVARASDGSLLVFAVDVAYVRFLLRARELWARSYAQYVATYGEDPILTAELSAEGERTPGMAYYPEHWDAADFAPIAEAMDEIFSTKGWRG